MKNTFYRYLIAASVLCIWQLVLSGPAVLAQRAMLRVTAVSYQEVALSWDRLPAGPESYEVSRKEDGPGQEFKVISGVLPGTTFSYQDKTVQPDRIYIYRVNAYCDKSCGGELNDVRVRTPVAPASAPSNLEAFYISGRGMALTWQGNNSDGTSFLLERADNGGDYNLIATVPYARSLSYQDVGLSAGNRYCYRVKARNASGDSPYSNESCVTISINKPRPPSALSAAVVNARQIDLAWTDNADNESGFDIERSENGSDFSKIAEAGSNAVSYQDKAVNPQKQYWYRLAAKNSGGSSEYSNVAQANTPDVAPDPPRGLSASPISNTQINLSWNDINGAFGNETGYELERSSDGNKFDKIADLAANVTDFQDKGLATLTRYWYRLRARNAQGFSDYSNVAEATTFDVPPAAPTELTATTQSSSQINLRWKDNAGNETAYEIERSTDGSTFEKVAEQQANTTTFESTGLSPATRYWYRVRAKNSVNPSAYSNIADATTIDVAPDPPRGLSASPVSNTQINLSWNDINGAFGNETGYELERSSDGNKFDKIADLAANVTDFQDKGLATLTRYWYRLRARNAQGYSDYSNVAEATTFDVPPAAPTELTATTQSSSQINLRWKDNAGNETAYEIERSTDGSTFEKVAEQQANTNTFESTGLAPATRYWFRVRAKNSVNPSAYSNIADATTRDVVPNTPRALAAKAVSFQQIDLSWTDASGNEAGFEIEISTDGSKFSDLTKTAANVTKFESKGLQQLTTYYFRVRAVNAIGKSEYSETAKATTQKAPIPDKPRELTATPIDFDLIQLKWAALSANATTVIVERSRKADADFVQIGTQPANLTQFPDREILDVYDYYYRIKAVNSAGASPYSDVVKVAASAIITGTEPASPDGLIYVHEKTLHVALTRPVSGELLLVNTRGIAVRKFALSQHMRIDLQNMPAGIYIAVLADKKTAIKHKILLY